MITFTPCAFFTHSQGDSGRSSLWIDFCNCQNEPPHFNVKRLLLAQVCRIRESVVQLMRDERGRATPTARATKRLPQQSCSEFLYWIKAARLRRAAGAGGQGPPPLPVFATAHGSPRRSARNTAKADSQPRE
jgi:hypothetical protein